MTTHRLPDTLDLHHDTPQVFRAQGGLLVAQGALTYPSIFAKYDDVSQALAQQGQAFKPARNISERWPVALDNEGLWTDERWGVFQVLEDASRVEWDLKGILEDVARNRLPMELRCPSLTGEETLLGRLLAVYGKRMGADPQRPGYNPTEEMRTTSLEDILKRKSRDELASFDDRGRTLLDLATRHQQWGAAEVAWKAGVRWSDNQIQSGRALESLVVGWMNLRGSTGMGWLQHPNKGDTGALRVAWLDTWLKRYESLGAAYPHIPQLNRRWRNYEASGTKTKPFFDTPATFFASHLFEAVGATVIGPERMLDFSRQMLDRWLEFWNGQGVDLLTQAIPKAVFFNDAPDETVGILERWKSVPVLEAMLVEARMQRELPCPDTSRPRGPRL